jgi:hypothetical protein
VTRVVAARPLPALRGFEARAVVDAGGQVYELVYRLSQGPISQSSSPFLAASLLPAMRIGEAMRVEGTVSPRLLASLPAIEGVFSGWFEGVQRIEVQAEPGLEPSGTGIACFFSGGVDSYYSVLKHLNEIDALVFVHGFDIQPRHLALRARISAGLRRAAARLGKPLIEVETNVRGFSDRFSQWSEEYHGSALASVALLLSPQFSRFYIPSTFSPRYSAPWGSHKHLDPLWSTEGTLIVHDGVEATRDQKASLLATSEVALQSVRVCWENRGGSYNCGRCEKCVRTMVNFRIAGALERCTAFPRPLDLSEVARLPIPDECARVFVEDNLEAAREIGDADLVRAIAASLNRNRMTHPGRARWNTLRKRVAGRVDRALHGPRYVWDLPEAPVESGTR